MGDVEGEGGDTIEDASLSLRISIVEDDLLDSNIGDGSGGWLDDWRRSIAEDDLLDLNIGDGSGDWLDN